MKSNIFRTYAALLAVVFGLTLASHAQTSPSAFENVDIKNFGQMDERYFRGGQPEPDDYVSLKDLGVKTVIDLRNDPTDYEKAEVEKLGMTYVNIPMSGWKTPRDRDIKRFLDLLEDPSTGTVYVHCKAGMHRTGVTGAIYRMEKYGWDYDKAYKEMRNYKFTSGIVHGALKTYVKDYARKMPEPNDRASVRTASAGTADH